MDIRLNESPQGPLQGIRVIDITAMITGPMCSQQLGDLGADVIKIEPTYGEVARWIAPPQKAGLTGFYSQLNRNKRSLAVDLKTPEGLTIVKKLAESADILVENFPRRCARPAGHRVRRPERAESAPGVCVHYRFRTQRPLLGSPRL